MSNDYRIIDGCRGNMDIAYCGSNCTDELCYRHASAAPRDAMRLAWSDFSKICVHYARPKTVVDAEKKLPTTEFDPNV